MQTATTPSRRRNNLLGQTRPDYSPIQFQNLLLDSNYSKINLRPIYQRNIRWPTNQMNDFIGTVMNNGFVPPIIQYKLSNDEKIGKNEGKDYEIIDGQHRLFTLKAFFDAKIQKCPHIKKEFIVHWNYENIPVFYKETEEVKEWCADNGLTPQYLTEDEQTYFKTFTINITTIETLINLDDRREIFLSLQKGIPVRNGDLLKNKTTDSSFIRYIGENNYEENMCNVFLKHCSKYAPKYWVNWCCRLLFMYYEFYSEYNKKKESFGDDLNDLSNQGIFKMILNDGVKQAAIAFTTKDPTYNSFIMKNKEKEKLNPSDDFLNKFDEVFQSFISFLNDLDEDIQFNPTQIFALFYCLCHNNINEQILISHMSIFSKQGKTKIQRNMWESNTDREIRKDYFKECFNQIMSWKEYAPNIDDKHISKSLKKLVWQKCKTGKCLICEREEITKHNFEVGHIQARALGGQGEIDNLLPMCFDCNRGMGTQNAYEYKKDMYPTQDEV